MVQYKTIVVPVDGSENAKRALEHALSVADRNEAQLIVVHPILTKLLFPVVMYPNKSLKTWKKTVNKSSMIS